MYKTPTSPVTWVDRESERRIISLIRKRFPTHTFLAEESAFLNGIKKNGSAGYRWIIDPLDGTVNYLHRIPQSCVSVAVEREGRMLAGGVYDPFRNELFMAVRGKGATQNGRRIRVSKQKEFKRSLLITGFPYNRHELASYLVAMVKPILRQGIDIRRLGAAALDLSWVACGRAEGFWEYKLSPWDVAAGWLLVEEAGGKVTDFKGKPLSIDSPQQTLATNGYIHASMTRIFTPHSRPLGS